MWQPKFAYTSAAVILTVLTVVLLPIWLVFYRMADPASNNGAGPVVADLVALGMMLTGGLVTAGAAWVIIIEMRGRVRMVDRLARTSERELPPADLDLAAYGPPARDEVTEVLARPVPQVRTEEVAEDPPTATPADSQEEPPDATIVIGRDRLPVAQAPLPTPVTAVPAPAPVSAVPATLEASGHLLHAFSRVLRAFSQLPAQVALLAVAMSLFVGATLLSLR